MNLPYRSMNYQLQTNFGLKVQKIPLDAGFTCPNKSGKISTQGCVFCDSYGSGYMPHHGLTITEQIQKFKLNRREKKFLAYFQAHCNTDASVEILSSLFDLALADKDICGLIIGTRPDCLSEDVISLLEEYDKKTFLVVELGLQSVHNASLKWLNRNHTYEQFLDGFSSLKKRDIRLVIHLILGIPGESMNDYCETVHCMNELFPWGIKFHLLHVLKDTVLHDRFLAGDFSLLGREEYIGIVVELIEWLHPNIGIQRLSADRDADLFVAPDWAQQKTTLINDIHQQLFKQGTWQGKKLGFSSSFLQEEQCTNRKPC